MHRINGERHTDWYKWGFSFSPPLQSDKKKWGSCNVLIILSVLLVLLATTNCTSQQTSSSTEITWDERLEIASGAGYRGPWRMNKSVFRYVDDPTVSMLKSGEIGIGWVDQSRKNIFFQRFTSDNNRRFDTPTNVSKSPKTFSWLPDMHMTERKAGNPDSVHVYMLWQEIVFSGGTHGGEAFFARSTDGGKTFGTPLNLSNSIAGDGKGRLTKKYWHNGSLDLAVGPEQRLYAAWTEYEGKLWVSRSVDQGQSFSDPLHVAGNYNNPARGPSLATDSAGNIYLAWTYGENSQADIMLTKSTNYGRSFLDSTVIISSKGHADASDITIANDQQIHLVYGVSPTGPFEQYEIRYSRAPTQSLSFKKSRTLSNPQSMTYEMGHYPSIAHSDSGHLHIIWELFRNAGSRPESLAFTHSSDTGHTFSSPIVIPGSASTKGTNGSQQGYLLDKITANSRGDVAIVNSTFQRGRASYIWLYRGHLNH